MSKFVLDAKGIVQAVVGLPLTMRGEKGAASVEVQKFVAELEEFLNVPVDVADERLSTAEAKKLASASGGDDHALAAQLFLDAYLQAHPHS
jgi:putative Holliday junction resolvase